MNQNDDLLFVTKVSKDVKKVRQFEEGLLRNYQRYLEILEQTIKGRYMYVFEVPFNRLLPVSVEYEIRYSFVSFSLLKTQRRRETGGRETINKR